MQHIADAVGVHKSTVHHALKGDPRVQEQTAARILAAAQKLGYDPQANQTARHLSLRKTGRREPNHLSALLFHVVFTKGAFFQRIFVSFIDEMSRSGHDVLTRVVDEGSSELPPAVQRGDADTVVALHHHDHLADFQDRITALPQDLRRPMISMINGIPNAWCVTPDIAGGGRMTMEHLLDLGHRRIITIAKMAFGNEARIEGAQAALRDRGLKPDRHLIIAQPMVSTKELRACLADALDRLLAAAPDATAMLAPHDEAAGVLIDLLAERGRAVPAAMSLIGFDDTHPVSGPDGSNILTTVALPLEDLGREAARLAMDPGPEPRTIVLPVKLIERATTRAI